MNNKSNKYSLLQKNENDESEMIELTEFKQGKPTNQPEINLALQYAELQDENTTTLITESKPTTKPIPQNTPNKQQNTDWQKYNVQKQNYQERPSLYNKPMYSAYPRQTKIYSNGVNPRPQNGPPAQKSSIPEMRVACTYCTVEQMVPATIQVYVCCCCNNMSECYPLYGLINCGRCQVRVCYPYGTSEMIRCIRCNTINKVETEPRIPEQRQIKKEKLESKPQPKPFMKEEEIVIEEEYEPVEPNNEIKYKEEELFLDDVPSSQKNEAEEFK